MAVNHIWNKVKNNTVPVHNMKAQKRSTNRVPHIPNLGTRWRWVV